MELGWRNAVAARCEQEVARRFQHGGDEGFLLGGARSVIGEYLQKVIIINEEITITGSFNFTDV